MEAEESRPESGGLREIGRASSDTPALLSDQETIREPATGVLPHATPPQIPAHRLLRCIGEGSYGTIWLAVNTMGTYRAVKIVYRRSFKEQRPYEREYEGIKNFEPLSRSHDGFVDIRQVERDDRAGYFYYVMELADDMGMASKLFRKPTLPKPSPTNVRNEAARPWRNARKWGSP